MLLLSVPYQIVLMLRRMQLQILSAGGADAEYADAECVAECAISVGAGAVCVVAKGAVVLSAIVVSALAADNVDIQ